MGLNSSKRIISNSDMLVGKLDLYNVITIKSIEHQFIKENTAKTILNRSLKKWQVDKVNAIWFLIDVKQVWWLPILLENEFVIHHAQPHYIMMSKWLLQIANKLPKYPFTFIGAGGLVVNKTGEILLIKERRGDYLGWKFPGGGSDFGELIHETAIREVFEETGVESEFSTILAFRQSLYYLYENASNIYFICVLRPKNLQLNPCLRETSACKWMSRKEIDNLPEEEFRWYSRAILQRYDDWVETGRRGCYYTELQKYPSKQQLQPSTSDNTTSTKKEGKPEGLVNKSIGFYLVE